MGRADLSKEYIRLLAEEGNGAVETDSPLHKPLLVVMIGPIRTWWGRIKSDEYKDYAMWRDAVRVALIHEGHLVYSPHRAWQGAWHEGAQVVNDAAIREADAVVVLTPDGVEATGTAGEIEVAKKHGVPIFYAPPADDAALRKLLESLPVPDER